VHTENPPADGVPPVAAVPTTGADAGPVGKCYVNGTNGAVTGRIQALGSIPGSGAPSYVIANENVPDRPWYMPVDEGRVVECGQATRERASSENLIGQCAYNPSDSAYLGHVTQVGAIGRNSYGEEEAGQRTVTVALTPERARRSGKETTTATYPRFLIVHPCAAKKRRGA
jgi:hypothetical protein